MLRDFGRRTGTDSDQRDAEQKFVRACIGRSEAIDLAAGFRVYVPDRAQFDAALARIGEVLGEESEEFPTFLGKIATALNSMGELRESRRLHERALASDLENLGEDHPSVATRRFNLAQICLAERDFAAAFAFLEQTLAGELRSLGRENPSLAYTRALLAVVLDHLGDRKRARREAREAARVVASQPEGSRNRALVEKLVGDFL